MIYNKEKQAVADARYKALYPERLKARYVKYRKEHPEGVKGNNQKRSRKGGEYYDTRLEYDRTGLRGERRKVRRAHARMWYGFKSIIAPLSQIHHEWIPGTADYRGIALVEVNQHMHGIIDVIHILDGEIRMFSEVDKYGGI